jgi:hypothetical protein
VRKDGSVAVIPVGYKWKEPQTIEQLKDVTHISGAVSTGKFYVQLSDGSWQLFNNGEMTLAQLPGLADLEFTVSGSETFVGDKIKAAITEKFSTGESVTVPGYEKGCRFDSPVLVGQLHDHFGPIGRSSTRICFRAIFRPIR